MKASDYIAELLTTHTGYADLFDVLFGIGRHKTGIGMIGSFTRLNLLPTYDEFSKVIIGHLETVGTISELMDYRFRYLDHGGVDKRLSNISHAWVYFWKGDIGRGKISPSTIQARWKAHKDSSIFVYVSEKHMQKDYEFSPLLLYNADFAEAVLKEIDDQERLLTYLGKCAYVAEMLGAADGKETTAALFPPAVELPRVRPTTEPLSADDLERFSNYQSDAIKFKDG